MPTYLEIFEALPDIEEARPAALKYANALMLSCFGLAAALAGWGWYVNSLAFIYAAYGALFLLAAVFVAYVIVEIRNIKKEGSFRKEWGLVRLDQRVDRETRVAADLAKLELSELKWMAQRLEAEVVTQERWLDVLKPFSMLLPAVLIVVSVDAFHLPASVRDCGKLLSAALLIGAVIAAVSIHQGIVPMRRVGSAIHCAIAQVERKQGSAPRKISRKRASK